MLTAIRKTLVFIAAIAAITLSTGHSALADVKVIEGSYIVTFKKDAGLIQAPNETNRRKGPVPFGEHSTVQSKTELASTLGTTGEVAAIFETINAVHMKMDAKEAERLSRDDRVLRVRQDTMTTTQTTQVVPNWGLDRLDSPTPDLSGTYNYVNTGAGQTIYILDSGLALSNANVAAEFGGRASIIWDVNGSNGNDCLGHGTLVASVAGGNVWGIAKGATLAIAKVTIGCTGNALTSTHITAFNWLAASASNGTIPKGTIANWSHGYSTGNCNIPWTNPDEEELKTAIRAAHNAGVIVVVAAGNDGCNTADYPPTNIPEVFVVGGTSDVKLYLPSGRYDARYSVPPYSSRTGSNVSAFAPAQNIRAMDNNGLTPGLNHGTSLAAPYIAGIFAVACQAAGAGYCATRGAANLYADLRNTGTLGTVKNEDGTPLANGSTSRFIRQQW